MVQEEFMSAVLVRLVLAVLAVLLAPAVEVHLLVELMALVQEVVRLQ
jgi:hypothetical protein